MDKELRKIREGKPLPVGERKRRAKISAAVKKQWVAKRALMLGSIRTAEVRQKKSEAASKNWADPLFRKTVTAKIKKAWSDPNLLKKHAKETQTRWQVPAIRAKAIQGHRKWINSAAGKKHLVAATQASSRKGESKYEKTIQKILKDEGVRFQTHHIILRRYVADLYLPDYKAIIECDGSGHGYTDQKEHDVLRDRRCNSVGIIVARIKVSQIKKNANQAVAKAVALIIKKRGSSWITS